MLSHWVEDCTCALKHTGSWRLDSEKMLYRGTCRYGPELPSAPPLPCAGAAPAAAAERGEVTGAGTNGPQSHAHHCAPSGSAAGAWLSVDLPKSGIRTTACGLVRAVAAGARVCQAVHVKRRRGCAPPLGRLPAAGRALGSPPLPPLATAAALMGEGGGACSQSRGRPTEKPSEGL